jgi:uroporphyrinogen-III synthase
VAALPLEGLTIGVTADRRADEQTRLLVQRGAEVLHGPVIRTATVDDDEPVRRATVDLLSSPPDVVIANTALGVRTWLALADSWGLTDDLVAVLGGAYVAARGPKAAGALLAAGVEIDWRAPSSVLADVVDHLLERGVAGRRIALQLAGDEIPGPEVAALRAAGADVVEVQTYRWVLPCDPSAALRLVDGVCNGRLDAVTFTAAPAVHNLLAVARSTGREEDLRVALSGPVLAMCVGPVCRKAAVEVGLHAAVEPGLPRLGGMVKALGDELLARRLVVQVEHVSVVVQGSVVEAGGERVRLAARERGVFEALVRRPGVVVPRGVLLADVWGSPDIDAHALEVAVGRLRRRLAPTGLTVAAVVRRGYRLTARQD